MANMSYCRFRNTLIDLRDCEEALAYEDLDELSGEERWAARRLIELCNEIAEDYGHLADELVGVD